MQKASRGFRNSTYDCNILGMTSKCAFRVGGRTGRVSDGLLYALGCLPRTLTHSGVWLTRAVKDVEVSTEASPVHLEILFPLCNAGNSELCCILLLGADRV